MRSRATSSGDGLGRPAACRRRRTQCGGPSCSARCSTRSASTSWSWWSRWSAAAGGDDGGLAHAGRQRRRDVRPDGDGRRHYLGAEGPFPWPGDVGTVPEGFGEAGRRRRDPVRSADLFDGYWGNLGSLRRGMCQTAGCAPGRRQMVRRQSKLIDRARDFLVTSGGKTISPSFIENILRASPHWRGGGIRARPVSRRADRDRLRYGRRPRGRTMSPTPASPAWRRARAWKS